MTEPSSEINSQAKVVSIDSAYMQARLPDVFVKFKERGQQGCMPLLQALFDHVDDALFEMADKADSNAAQNMYFESMREVRLKRRGMELSFLKSIEEAFHLAVTRSGGKLEPVAELNTTELSLVANDELEELMASSSLVSKAEKTFVQPLAVLMARLNTLLPDSPITAENNPLGPAVICKAFVDSCQALDTDINTKLVLFKLFDRYVVSGLAAVYNSCNDLLADAGVMADASPSQLTGKQATANTGNVQSAEVFANLQALLKAAPQVSSPQGAGLQSAGQAPQIPHESLMSLLQLVQQNLLSQGVTGQAHIDIQQSLNDLCVERMPGQAVSIGQVDDDTINLVSMLFQFMLEDRNLAAPIKTQLARMQIPIVRVAMNDKSFFSRGGHPARKLLNVMATSALGWEEPKNIERDPLYKKIGAIVGRLLEDFEGGADVYEEILNDFTAFVELERRRANLIEQRTLDAEDGKAKSELAREAVKQLLQDKLAGRDVPPVVMNLLQEAWSNVLFLANLKEGEDSLAWQQAVTVVDELLWSVEEKVDAGDRKRLLQLIPNLLKSLRTGLTQVAFNPFEMNQMFDELENIHLNQLRQPAVSTAAEVEPASSENTEVDRTDDNALLSTGSVAEADQPMARDEAPQTLDQMLTKRAGPDVGTGGESLDIEREATGDELLSELDEMDDLEGFDGGQPSVEKDITPAVNVSESPFQQQVDQLSVGNWLEMLQDDGSRLRCRLAAIIRGTGKYIFVNRAGMKVAEHTRDSLAQAIQDEEAFTLEDGLLFDRALESVIGNLREMKSQGAS